MIGSCREEGQIIGLMFCWDLTIVTKYIFKSAHSIDSNQQSSDSLDSPCCVLPLNHQGSDHLPVKAGVLKSVHKSAVLDTFHRIVSLSGHLTWDRLLHLLRLGLG